MPAVCVDQISRRTAGQSQKETNVPRGALGGLGETHMACGDAGGLDPGFLDLYPLPKQVPGVSSSGPGVRGHARPRNQPGRVGAARPARASRFQGSASPGPGHGGRPSPGSGGGTNVPPRCQVNPGRGCDGHAPISRAPGPAGCEAHGQPPATPRAWHRHFPLPVAHAAERKPRTWPTTKSGPWVCNALS